MLRFLQDKSGKKLLQEHKNGQWEFVPVVKEEKKLEEKKLELEDKNFRVDSIGWKKEIIDSVPFLVSPCGGIREYLYSEEYPELTGEQLFNWKAAMTQTKKHGKRIPTDEEFNLFEKKDFGKIIYAGFFSDGHVKAIGRNANFWTSSKFNTSGQYFLERVFYLEFEEMFKYNMDYEFTISVRCLKC